MLKRSYLLVLLLILSLATVKAQPSLYSMEVKKPGSTIPNIAFFKEGHEVSLSGFGAWLSQTYKLSEGLSLRLFCTVKDELGMIHYRYLQTYRGLDLEGTMLVVHTRNGMVTGFNGIAFNNFKLSVKPTLSQASARADAISWFGTAPKAEEFVYQLPSAKIQDSLWKGLLIIAPVEGKIESPIYKLAWRFDFYSPEGPKREHIFVDARAGGVIYSLPLLHSADSSSTVRTAYRGVKSVKTFYNPVTGKYESHSRSKFIQAHDLTKYDTANSEFFHFFNPTSYWAPNNLDSFANDAYWGMEQADDMFQNWFGRNGFDGNGAGYKAYIHGNYTNAYWYGNAAAFGDGCAGTGVNCTVFPLTSLDIVGHEFTHGVTQTTSGLVYAYEPGALNEAMSDIFGKTLEWYADSTSGKFTWKIGKDFGIVFRDMKNSPLRFYKGKNWYIGAGDYGGVHTNSQVLNYFYYLITAGDTGTNQVGYTYDVDSLGFYAASHIMYRLQTAYLFSYSDYPDMANCVILAAADLYGNCSREVQAVAEALRAIGLTPATLIAPGNSLVTKVTSSTVIGTQKVCLIKLLIKGDCSSTANDSMQAFRINMTGTSSLGSIRNLRIYYTGDKNVPDTSTLVYAQGSVSMNTLVNKKMLLKKTSNIFWVMCDVRTTAKHLDLIDVGIDSLRMNNAWQVPDDHNPPGKVIILRCKPRRLYNSCSISKVSMIQFAGVTLLDSSCSLHDSSYRFFDPGFFVTPGSAYSLKVRTHSPIFNYGLNSVDTNFVHVWLDINRNGLFEATELRLHGKLPNPALAANITIPGNQPYGRILMRIINTQDSASGDDPCNWPYGSACDVMINIGNPISSVSPALGCAGKETVFSAVADTAVTYNWYLDGFILQSGRGAPWNVFKHTPSQPGSYSVMLRTFTSTGPLTAAEYTESVKEQVVSDSMPAPIYGPTLINLCQGQQTVLTTDSLFASSSGNTLQITYDPSLGKSGLKTAAKVYMHAGLVNAPGDPWKYIKGNWGKDDGIGQMTKVGTKWQISLNALSYFKPEQLNELKYIVLIFRNADGSQFGTNTGGGEIFIKIDSTAPVSLFNGVTALFRKTYTWYKDGIIVGAQHSLNVSATGNYYVDVAGSQCGFRSATVSVNVDSLPVAGTILPGVSKICQGLSATLRLKNSKGSKLDWQMSTGTGWTSTSIVSDSIMVSPAQTTWYKVLVDGGACASVQTDSVRVDVDTPPIAGTITPDKNILCRGGSAILELTGYGGNLTWQQKIIGGWSPLSGSQDTITVYPPDDLYYRAELKRGICPAVYADSVLIRINDIYLDSITATPGKICEDDSAFIQVYSGTAAAFQWYKNSQAVTGIIQSGIWVQDSSSYSVRVSDSLGCNVTSVPVKIAVQARPLNINFIQSGHLLYVDSTLYTGMNINWYRDGLLQNSHNFSLYVDGVHTYSATVSDASGCSRASAPYSVYFTGTTDLLSGTIKIYPNPSSGIYHIVSDLTEPAEIMITDMMGRSVVNMVTDRKEIDLSREAAGVYLLHLHVNGIREHYRLIKY